MPRLQVALLGLSVAVLFGAALLLGDAQTSPTTIRSFIDLLDADGVECSLRGDLEQEHTSMFGGEVELDIQRGTCELDGAEVTVWTWGTARQKDAYDEEHISGHGRTWLVDGATWSAQTIGEDAARAIHDSLGGELEPPGT